MSDTDHKNAMLLLPSLAGFYRAVVPLSWPIIRFAAGSTLIMHGWNKVPTGPWNFAGAYVKMGLEPGLFWAWSSTLIEVVGGFCIMVGLFTRFFAAAAAIEMAMIVIIYLPNGYAWLNRGYEFALMWGLMCFAIALRGGGPYSVDRRIGVEL